MAAKHRKPFRPWDSGPAEREPSETCLTTGKRKYFSEAEAEATARHQMSQKQSSSLQLRTYRCLYCDGWHLTSSVT